MTIAGGISAALLHRERTGESPTVDVSLLGTGMWAAGAAIALGAQLGIPWQHPGPVRTEIRNPLTNAYKTKDGKWLFLSSLQGFKYWPSLCLAVGRPDLVDDDRFTTHERLTDNAFVAMQILEEVFATASLDEWRERLDGFDGQWAPVVDTLEVTHDPQVVANGYIVHAETSEGVRFPLVAAPVQFDGAPAQPRRAPEFNEHGDDILSVLLGLESETIIDLKIKGVVA
jgi:crotonobetainyl-CoA:carnitine CoA-transferase CaiB-like acyl-CoA transferase